MGEPAAPMAAGTRVLCFHNGLLNEAQILDSAERPNVLGKTVHQYLIHYVGWSKNWDEWVERNRLQPLNDTSLALKAEIQKAYEAKQQRAAETRGGRGGRTKRGGDGGGKASKRARRGGNDVDTTPGAPIKLVLPDELKLLLVDDWDKVSRQSMVTKLQRDITISKVLADFLKQAETLGPRAASVAAEVTSGLKVYFNTYCGTALLYEVERQQFKDFKEEFPDVDLTEAYGPEHLLRLLTKLPSLLSRAGVPAKGLCYVAKCIEDLTEYLKAHSKSIFLASAYIPTSDQGETA
eukprot:m.187496 g.187496  ORF g.187496 m.187496 type:complete len:293 (+) comp17105_c0_seq1:36-914(+)